ncbi:hypothetical protein [Reichenbachiella sp.]|uniref:hypothetical protein n=1 Tax=Reichenbachiella sp. TaxID=2184521 RepID=UPI003BAFDA17
MNLSKKYPIILVVILIGISVLGLFEKQALTFVSGVFEKNLRFIELTAEVKLVISGLSSIKLPFIEGMTSDLDQGLGKVLEYLLITDIISFLQVMLLSISKSWMLKLIMVVLFLLSFVKSTKAICTKLLILSLSLSPGLAIYSLGVQQLAKQSSIDFGEKYLKKLETQVDGLKSDKLALMKQHQSDLTKIKNGQKGIHILQKFREDVSYDFKRVKNDIHGLHTHIRLFIREAGHEMKSKIYGFCSMILFCMLVLPLGYALIIYMLISSLFNINSTHLGLMAHQAASSDPEKPSGGPTFGQKFKKVFNVYLEEFHSIKNKAAQSNLVQTTVNEVESIEHNIASKVEASVGNQVEHSKPDVQKEAPQTQSKVTVKKTSESKDGNKPPETASEKPRQGGNPSKLSI